MPFLSSFITDSALFAWGHRAVISLCLMSLCSRYLLNYCDRNGAALSVSISVILPNSANILTRALMVTSLFGLIVYHITKNLL